MERIKLKKSEGMGFISRRVGNPEEIPYSLWIVPMGLCNAAHLKSDLANPLRGLAETRTYELTLGSQAP